MRLSNNHKVLNMYRDMKREADDLERRRGDLKNEIREMEKKVANMHGENWDAALMERYQKSLNMESMYNRAKSRCMNSLKEIEGAIEGLHDPKARLILRRRFIDGETVEEIAKDIGYAAPTVYEIQRNAVARLRFENYKSLQRIV